MRTLIMWKHRKSTVVGDWDILDSVTLIMYANDNILQTIKPFQWG